MTAVEWVPGRWDAVEIGQAVCLRNVDGAEVEIAIAMRSDVDYRGHWVRSESCRYDAEDWDLFVVSPLPTEPGSYVDRTGAGWTITVNGGWRCGHKYTDAREAIGFAPFTLVERVPFIAKRVLEALERVYGEDYLHNPDSGWNKVAAEFGVTL